jgi:ankyrin repeat protein
MLLLINRYEKYSWAIPMHVPGLWLATKFGLYTICKLILRNGYLVDEKTSEGSIALHAVAGLGWFNIVALLVESGGSISGGTNLDSDAIPLLEAPRNDHQYVVELLLDWGADINIKSRSGRTALHEAMGNSKEEVANLLVNRGVDVTAQTKSSLWTVLHSEASQGNMRPVFALLGHGAYLDAKTSEEETALEIAIDRGHDAIAQQLVTVGSDIHSRNRRGDLPLHLAAAKGLSNLCSEIIARGCEMNARNYMGQTPLHKAAECNCLQVIEILFREQAQSSIVDWMELYHYI